ERARCRLRRLTATQARLFCHLDRCCERISTGVVSERISAAQQDNQTQPRPEITPEELEILEAEAEAADQPPIPGVDEQPPTPQPEPGTESSPDPSPARSDLGTGRPER
ncbi:MAG: hypothetical protein ACPGYV_11395, partial [Phycisphaeraceae bacterium]